MTAARETSTVASTSQSQRAKWAWDEVARVLDGDDEYLTEARKLPARLLSSGLGQTLAYLYAKGKPKDGEKVQGKGTTRLFTQLAGRIRELEREPTKGRSAMDIIVGLDPIRYRFLSRELLECAEWIKRFADGRLGSKDEAR